MDANEMMWQHAATDHAAAQNLTSYAMAKVAAQQASWTFLAAADTPSEFQARYDIIEDRVAAAVDALSPGDTGLLDQVKASLREDFQMMLTARRQERVQRIAAAWAAESGPLHILATTGTVDPGIWTELNEVVGQVTDTADRSELAVLVRALGGRANFPIDIHTVPAEKAVVKQAVVNDPEDVAHQYDSPAAFTNGYHDAYYNDNAGEREFGRHPDYASGQAEGWEAQQHERENPDQYNESMPYVGSRTAAAKLATHPPYYVRQQGGKHVVVNAIGDVKGTFDTKEQARQQQKALYAAVPGAAEKARQEHGHTPEKVQQVGTKASRTADLQGARWGFMDRTGVFHPVAVNEDAYGSDRYQHTPTPATPGWINDEYADHKEVALGDTPVKNNADGDELKPNAPWLVAEESLRRLSEDSNPFTFSGPGNPDMPAAPPAAASPGGTDPIDDGSQIGVMPDATSLPPDTSMGDPTNPSLNDMPAADGTNLAPQPSSDGSTTDDNSSITAPTTTSGRYSQPASMLDRIAAQVFAANPGLGLRRSLAIAEQTVVVHPEMAR
jgi:hypothetical protein